MKVVQINSTLNYSTGKIALAISNVLNASSSNQSMVFYAYGKANLNNTYKFTNSIETFFNKCCSHLFGNYGFYGKISAKRILKQLEKIKPDIVHIHNIHSHEVDFWTLVKGINRIGCKIVYTFHDCWAFTGYCPYFDFQKCNKWKEHCDKCPQKNRYSLLFDHSYRNFEKKMKALMPLDFTIVSPSRWLDKLVGQSFLSTKNRVVLKNGIDLNTFKPTYSRSVLQRFNIDGKQYILGVAAIWEKRKGLFDLLQISKHLPEGVLLVIVGHLLNKIDIAKYPNVVFINNTNTQNELACLYSHCICLVNPTMEDNLPTVNLECVSCGRPVVTYDTGGCKETINENSGILIKKGHLDDLLDSVLKIVNNGVEFKTSTCVDFAKQFDQRICFSKYIELYRHIIGKK